MSASAFFPVSISDQIVSVLGNRFAPFGKGGYGGFALRVIEEQEQIHLDPLFPKGEKKAHRVAAPFSDVGESSMQVVA